MSYCYDSVPVFIIVEGNNLLLLLFSLITCISTEDLLHVRSKLFRKYLCFGEIILPYFVG